MLKADKAANSSFVRLISELTLVRRDARISQATLSSHVGVHGNTISEWESLRSGLTLVNLTRWSAGLDRCLVVIGPDGKLLMPEPLALLPDETGDSFDLRRLAGPLKHRREALKLSQKALGGIVGVSGSSISYWELTRIPPRPIAQIVWAQKLGCSIALWHRGLVLLETIRAMTG
jgi:transcriptional regulator with XRE-family HTH domain